VIERAVLLARHPVIDRDDLELNEGPPPSFRPIAFAEARTPGPVPALPGSTTPLCRVVREALEACAGNQTLAAARLGIGRRTLSRWLDALEIPRPRKHRPPGC
jgi:DNA-binding NtrC family response regulator